MGQYPILKNAPIKEALVDIRVKLPANLEVNKIESIHNLISDSYPEKQIQKKLEAQLKVTEKEPFKTSDVKIYGYRFLSSDKKQIIQARVNGFTLSKLKPYIKWEQLRDEARRLWKLYFNITSPELITRVALRYINNLNIPMPIKDFGDYLTAPPLVPQELPQGVSSFLTRVVISEPSIGATAIITHALEPSANPKVLPIILDIDVFRNVERGMEEKDIWKTIEQLHIFKNKIFFNSITEKLKEIYK